MQPECCRNLAELTRVQLAYFKACHEALAELAPEMDELQGVSWEEWFLNVMYSYSRSSLSCAIVVSGLNKNMYCD
jgi:hypothetical protein